MTRDPARRLGEGEGSNLEMSTASEESPSVAGKETQISSAMTMDHIARLAKVSKATVSRSLRDSPLVNRETKKLVLEAARASGYAVNKNAQKLRDKRTNTVAIALDFPSYPGQRISDPFIFELLSDIVIALSIRDQEVLLCSPRDRDALSLQNILAAKSADGIIFIGQGDKEHLLEDLAKARAPLVVWGAAHDHQAYCTVGSDNSYGGYLAGKRFNDLGFSKVLFVGNTQHLEFRLRKSGLESALREGGGDGTVAELTINELTYEGSYRAAQQFLKNSKNSVEAVFAVSDIMAIAFAVALKEAGMSPGKDVAIIGYNDIPVASYFSPAITTVRQDTQQAGGLLVEKLMQILEGIKPKSVTLPTNLIIRET